MITVTKYDNLNLKIDTDDWDYLRELKEHFSHYTEGYKFSPLYKVGKWNGKVSLFNSMNRTLPFGLLMEWMKFHKFNYPTIPTNVDISVKEMFKGIEPIYTKDLLYDPYDYQDDCIRAALKTSKGILRVATAGGKSCIISYIIKGLMENGKLNKALIIVPSISLVTQFYSDMTEYGMDMDIIGRVGDVYKEWDNKIVISTWQSLNNVPERMKDFNVVVVDETHGVRGDCLRDLMSQAINAEYRFGVTGTMPDNELEYLQVLSYIGPILREYGSAKLAEMGYIAKCKIKAINISYRTNPKGEYNEVKDAVFNNPFRLKLISDIVRDCDGSVILLVGKVEDEGKVLRKYLEEQDGMENKEICFLSGKDKGNEREYWRQYTNSNKHVVLIATYGIMAVGINVPSLRYLMFASPFKSKIRVLQSIGRTLRKHVDKTKGALIWDLCDNVKFLKDHSNIRMKHYAKEDFEVEDLFLSETMDFELDEILRM